MLFGSKKYAVSPQSVSKWERGDTLPDIMLLPALANIYKVTVYCGLLSYCINSVAVANAIDEVKSVANYVCGDCYEDGAAKWLEANVL